MAELLLDVPGALWTMDRIEELRSTEAPTLARVVIAVDPSGSGNQEADEHRCCWGRS
jgi:phage terminase large subunit-like protein